MPISSQTLNTPVNSKSDHKLTYTAGNSATYLLDPPSLNNYIERHAKLLHSALQTNSDLSLGGNDSISDRSNSAMNNTGNNSMAEVLSM